MRPRLYTVHVYILSFEALKNWKSSQYNFLFWSKKTYLQQSLTCNIFVKPALKYSTDSALSPLKIKYSGLQYAKKNTVENRRKMNLLRSQMTTNGPFFISTSPSSFRWLAWSLDVVLHMFQVPPISTTRVRFTATLRAAFPLAWSVALLSCYKKLRFWSFLPDKIILQICIISLFLKFLRTILAWRNWNVAMNRTRFSFWYQQSEKKAFPYLAQLISISIS